MLSSHACVHVLETKQLKNIFMFSSCLLYFWSFLEKIKDQIHRTIHHVHKLKTLVLWRCHFFLNYYQDSVNLIQSYSRVGGFYCHCFNTKLQTCCKTCMKMQRPKNNKHWSWSSNTLVTWCKELTHWKRPRCWERLKAKGEGDNRGWDDWMASLIQWTWVWANSGR